MESLEDRLIRHEGIKLMPYKDHLGYLTIGIGRCIERVGISKEEALILLRNDIEKAKQQAAKFNWFDSLNDERQGVIVEMIFQLGFGGVSNFKKMIAAIEQGDFEEASEQMLDSTWYKQTPARCAELSEIMRSGEV